MKIKNRKIRFMLSMLIIIGIFTVLFGLIGIGLTIMIKWGFVYCGLYYGFLLLCLICHIALEMSRDEGMW